jgi:hypothetical protein
MTDKTRIILDISTNRIIFFTKDYNQTLIVDENTVLYDYTKPLPENLTISNCWNFRLNGQTIEETKYVNQNLKESELSFNKKTFIKQINARLNEEIEKLIFELEYSEFRVQEARSPGSNLILIKEFASQNKMSVDEAIAYTLNSEDTRNSKIKIIEYVRQQYIKRAMLVTNNKQLMLIRDRFMNRKSFRDLNKTEKINYISLVDSIDVSEMLSFIETRVQDWNLDTARQKQLACQKDTESIYLIKNVLENDLKGIEVWHSEKFVKTEEYSLYAPIINYLEKFAKERNSNLTKIAITKLLPGGFVAPHYDYGGYYISKDRYHLVLSGDYLYIVDEDTTYRPKVGDVFWFDNKLEHYSINVSKEPRISVIFDMQPADQSTLKSTYGANIMKDRLKNDLSYIKNLSTNLLEP